MENVRPTSVQPSSVQPSSVQLSPAQIRVLAHPLRSRLLGSLRLNGPATATRLAKELDTNTGATSYHLRQLAEVGLVTEEERPGGGRKRWWRAEHEMSSWSRSQYDDDPGAAAAADWLTGRQIEQFNLRVEAWRHAEPQETAPWRDAAEVSDYYLDLDAEQARALMAEIGGVIERYRHAEPGPGARQVLLYIAAVPRVEVPS